MKKKIILILCILFLICGFIFLRWKANKKKGSEAKSEEIKYSAMKVVNSNGKSYITADGKVEANDTKKVYVDKKLRVKEIFVKEGDYVEKGTLLMTFDENTRNTVKRNIAKEKLNLSKLRRNLSIERQLNKIGGSSLNTVRELEEEVQSSEITIAEYNEDLEKTLEEIKSPVSGTITSLTAEENYAVNTEQPLMEITDLTTLKIVLEVPEYDIVDVKIGQKSEIKPEVYEKKKTFTGVVSDISKVSETSASTSENILKVEIKLDEIIPNLAPGFKVTGTIFLDAGEEGINIPKTALLEDNGKYFVYTVNDKNQLEKKFIEISQVRKGDDVTVTKGLNLGETLLTTPDINIKPGDTIQYTIKNAQRTRKATKQGGGPGGGGPPM